MFQLWSVGTHPSSLPQTGLISSIPAKWMGGPVGRTPARQWRTPTGKRNIGRDLTHTGLYVIDSDRASSISVIPSVHPDHSFIPTSGGVSSSVLTTGQLIQPLTRVADIQISATGGDVTVQTSIQTSIQIRIKEISVGGDQDSEG